MEQVYEFPPHALMIARLAVAAFFMILFVQSGFDKLLNFRENLSWLVGHFKDTLLSGLVPIIFVLIMFSEVATGVLSAYGIVEILIHKRHVFAFWGAAFASLSFIFLFFGQRIAKDYSGAATLVPYFTVAVLSVLLLA